jgi:hypothetical protein
LDTTSKRSAAERAEARHQTLLEVAGKRSAGCTSEKPCGSSFTAQCGYQLTPCHACAGKSKVKADTRDHGQQLLEEACFGEARLGVDGKRTTCGHGQPLEAVNLVGRHMDQHGVLIAPHALKLLGQRVG